MRNSAYPRYPACVNIAKQTNATKPKPNRNFQSRLNCDCRASASVSAFA